MIRDRSLRLASATLLLIGAVACGPKAPDGPPLTADQKAAKALLVSAESLKFLSKRYKDASDETNRRCTAVPRLPPMTLAGCNEFATFQDKFVPSFDHAAALWEIGRRTRDASIEGGATAIIRGLAIDLAGFAGNVLAPTSAPDGGK